MNAVRGGLTQQGIVVVSMRNKVNRLEELVMRLVESKGAAGAQAG